MRPTMAWGFALEEAASVASPAITQFVEWRTNDACSIRT